MSKRTPKLLLEDIVEFAKRRAHLYIAVTVFTTTDAAHMNCAVRDAANPVTQFPSSPALTSQQPNM